MDYSITGIAYLTLFLVLLFLAYRFFQYWKKEKSTVSRLWFYIIVLVEIFTLSKALVGLFFSNNTLFLEMSMNVAAFVQAFIFATLAYLIIYLKFPKISPWFGFAPVLVLGLIAHLLTVMTSFDPRLESTGSINWGFPSGEFVLLTSILRLFLALLIFIPLIIIFFQEFKTSQSPSARGKSIGLFLAIIFGSLVGLLDFLLVSFLKVDPIWRDISTIAIAIILFVTLIFTLPRSSYED